MPYKLQWLNEDEKLVVNHQVKVPFSIGHYEDEALCDVVPMEATHLLLGRPWQFDTKAVHDGFTNRISFLHHGKKVVLKPLSPKEVRADQIKMREKLSQEKKRESEKEVSGGKEKQKESGENLDKNQSEREKNNERRENLCVRKKLCEEKPLKGNKNSVFGTNSNNKGILVLQEHVRKTRKKDGQVCGQRVKGRSREREKKKSPPRVLQAHSKGKPSVKCFSNPNPSLLFIGTIAIDLRTNLLQEGGNDEDPPHHGKDATGLDAIQGLGGPMARGRERKGSGGPTPTRAAICSGADRAPDHSSGEDAHAHSSLMLGRMEE